jgi:hypothetical protein
MSRFGVSKFGGLVLLLLVILFFLILFAAPLEKTLGEAIRYVYVHVAFTWAGMFGFYLAGLLGLIVIFRESKRMQKWAQVITWVALGLFIGGGIFSILSQLTSWGGILWQEPRNRTSMMVMAIALIVLILNGWLPWIRVRGALYFGLAIFVAWIIPNTPLVFHPENAASGSESTMIRGAFALLTINLLLIGAWFVWQIGRAQKRQRLAEPSPAVQDA